MSLFKSSGGGVPSNNAPSINFSMVWGYAWPVISLALAFALAEVIRRKVFKMK